ncbi:hypothetical protein GJW-30_1_04489 [Variibacter gotjawalensis]|uniref:Serine protease n=1 Tax=Variibacter gotjawalensis TaxID=1333996 RepID=A0A0S3Q154_9BRAD|nr:hypothetical protein [Variibacter gotjawalensis]NIK47774.1 hypothetical protein [Variibacter gotjawalensis]RZS49661.1 hypothetical protein EV661_2100 [Variibacter gotjawalensis]BAT61927.1 hypothetical protein GJW-30_1_04489 [Variibacter gotjawalensis]
MKHTDLQAVFARYAKAAGARGVAFGPKETLFSTQGNPNAVTFFVDEKVPLRGAKRRLADGRVKIPQSVTVAGQTMPTDVVVFTASEALTASTRSPAGTYRAGGKISNLQNTGTIGCFVRRDGDAGLFAMTNRHVALDIGTQIAFPSFDASFYYRGATAASTELVADEVFLPPFNGAAAYIDVDCALVRVPVQQEAAFTPEIPVFGAPQGVFVPNAASPQAYAQSLLNRPVYSYSWQSKARQGVVSHIYYVYQSAGGMQRIACFLVRSIDQFPPGILGDSGKLWMTKVNGINQAVGLHSGVVAETQTGPRFAMARDFSAIARFFKVRLV